MRKQPIVLTVKQRAILERFCTTGVHDVRFVNRAKIILALDNSGGRTPERHEAIAEKLGITRQTVSNSRDDFLKTKYLTDFLQRKKRETPPVPAKVTGEMEARLIALACSKAPKGYSRWSLRLLAEKSVELHYFGTLSHMTISRLLKKHNLNLT
jgi:hypothetical protein